MGIASKAGDIFSFVFDVVLRLFLTAILAVFVTMGLFFFFGDLPVHSVSPPIEEPLARARLDAETEAATELGFALDRAVRIESRAHDLDLQVGAGECVALIATVWGPYRVWSVTAVPPGSEPSTRAAAAVLASGAVEGLVAHGQACSDEATTWRVGVRTSLLEHDDPTPFAAGELRILRAPSATVEARLNRGYVLR